MKDLRITQKGRPREWPLLVVLGLEGEWSGILAGLHPGLSMSQLRS